jgi:deoxyribonuclease-4
MIGAHINSDPDQILNEAMNMKKHNYDAIQLFVDPFYAKKKEYDEFGKYCKENNIKVIVHASYVINCAQNWNEHSWWVQQFILEINAANKIGAHAIVIHLGKQLKLSKEEAINNMFTSFLHVHRNANNNVKILIETSSGQGTEMCYNLNELAMFFRKFSKNKKEDIRDRFGLCMDTCHIFAAGYDITDIKKVEKFLDMFEEIIGIKYIQLVHLNDSKNELNSHVDRHADIGKGFIGKSPLVAIYNFFIKLKIPVILETPTIDINPFV